MSGRGPTRPRLRGVAERLRTVSLARRVMVLCLAVLAVVLSVVSMLALVFTGIGNRADLVGQLNARAVLADQLARQGARPATIVERVRAPEVWVRLVEPSGVSYDSSAARTNSPKPVKVYPPNERERRTPNGSAPSGPVPDAGAAAGPNPGSAGSATGNAEPGNAVVPGGPRFPAADLPPGPVVRRTLADGSRLILYGDPIQIISVQRRLSRLLVLLGFGGLGLAALALLATTRLALRPLDAMTALARSIAAGDRGHRLAPTQPDTELGRAAAAFDDMLDALEGAERAAKHAELAARRSEERTRQFVADAAHELRTPIAGLRAAAEAALSSRASGDERDRLFLLLIRETGRAGRLVEDLLALAQIDAGLRLQRQDVELRGLAEAEAERVRLQAPSLSVRVVGGPLTVSADPQRLAQVLANLLDNARRYTPDGGEITVTVDRVRAAEGTAADALTPPRALGRDGAEGAGETPERGDQAGPPPPAGRPQPDTDGDPTNQPDGRDREVEGAARSEPVLMPPVLPARDAATTPAGKGTSALAENLTTGHAPDRPSRPAPNGAAAPNADHMTDLARVRVADTGPGVPAEERERIFDRLVRLDNARTPDARPGTGRSAQGGAGLGLAIARGIARAHGGELRCTPESVFELTLPVAPGGELAAPDARPAAAHHLGGVEGGESAPAPRPQIQALR